MRKLIARNARSNSLRVHIDSLLYGQGNKGAFNYGGTGSDVQVDALVSWMLATFGQPKLHEVRP